MVTMRNALIAISMLGIFGTHPVNAQDYCQRSFDNNRCPKCNQIGRAYTPVPLIPTAPSCTVCLGLCNLVRREQPAPNAVGLSDQGRAFEVIPLETETPMVVTASKSLLYEIADTNPEAAAILLTLALRSVVPQAIPPTKGDGGSAQRITRQGAIEAISAFGTPVTHRDGLTAPYSDPDHSTRWTWELVRKPGGVAELALRHRVVNGRDEVVDSPLQDIAVTMDWVPSNGGGFWKASSWKVIR